MQSMLMRQYGRRMRIIQVGYLLNAAHVPGCRRYSASMISLHFALELGDVSLLKVTAMFNWEKQVKIFALIEHIV